MATQQTDRRPLFGWRSKQFFWRAFVLATLLLTSFCLSGIIGMTAHFAEMIAALLGAQLPAFVILAYAVGTSIAVWVVFFHLKIWDGP